MKRCDSIQVRVSAQWLFDTAPCQPSFAWLEPPPCPAKGQRYQEGFCLSIEAAYNQTGTQRSGHTATGHLRCICEKFVADLSKLGCPWQNILQQATHAYLLSFEVRQSLWSLSVREIKPPESSGHAKATAHGDLLSFVIRPVCNKCQNNNFLRYGGQLPVLAFYIFFFTFLRLLFWGPIGANRQNSIHHKH